jgi:hypothetical protein
LIHSNRKVPEDWGAGRESKKHEKGIRRWKKAAGGRREGVKMKWCGMRKNIIEGIQTYNQSNEEPDANLVVVVMWREGEAIRQKA